MEKSGYMNKFVSPFSKKTTVKKLYVTSFRYRVQVISSVFFGEFIVFYFWYTLSKDSLHDNQTYSYLLLFSAILIFIIGIIGVYFYFTSILLKGNLCVVKKVVKKKKIENFYVKKEKEVSFLGEIINIYIIYNKIESEKIYCLDSKAKAYLDRKSMNNSSF